MSIVNLYNSLQSTRSVNTKNNRDSDVYKPEIQQTDWTGLTG